jgi:adenylate kinase
MKRVSSLHIEHVSPASLMRREISRPASHGSRSSEAILTALRRWFWTRKPDAGFLLTEFPATLLQALVFDEWLDTRCEALDAMLVAPDAPTEVLEHYCNLGLPSLEADTVFTR